MYWRKAEGESNSSNSLRNNKQVKWKGAEAHKKIPSYKEREREREMMIMMMLQRSNKEQSSSHIIQKSISASSLCHLYYPRRLLICVLRVHQCLKCLPLSLICSPSHFLSLYTLSSFLLSPFLLFHSSYSYPSNLPNSLILHFPSLLLLFTFLSSLSLFPFLITYTLSFFVLSLTSSPLPSHSSCPLLPFPPPLFSASPSKNPDINFANKITLLIDTCEHPSIGLNSILH